MKSHRLTGPTWDLQIRDHAGTCYALHSLCATSEPDLEPKGQPWQSSQESTGAPMVALLLTPFSVHTETVLLALPLWWQGGIWLGLAQYLLLEPLPVSHPKGGNP